MKQRQQDLMEAVGNVRHKLNEWRKGERSPRRIPESIWDEAVGLASQYGNTVSAGYAKSCSSDTNL